MMYGEGISRTGEVLDIATELEIIKKGGSWFSYGDRKLGQGRDNVKELLKTDPELMAEIEEQILARKDELMDKDKKKNSKNTAAAAIAEVVKAAANEDDEEMKILDSIDDEFDEFTPAD
jgi:recombination protein RecA